MIVPGSRVMTKSEISQTSKDNSSLTVTLLASSATFAAFTTLLYFVGGAYYEGRTIVLGTAYLAMPPANSLVYTGAELLLATGLIVVVFCSAIWFFRLLFHDERFAQWLKNAASKVASRTRVWEMSVSGAVLVGVMACVGILLGAILSSPSLR